MSEKKMIFSDEDIEKAININILDVAERLGFHLVKQGNVYSTKEHDSLKIYPYSNTFYRFSTGVSGNTINFVRHFSNMDFVQAMKFLIGENINYNRKNDFGKFNENKAYEKNKFYLPKMNNNIKRAYSYLINTRKISKEVLNEFINNKKV